MGPLGDAYQLKKNEGLVLRTERRIMIPRARDQLGNSTYHDGAVLSTLFWRAQEATLTEEPSKAE